MTWLDQLNLYLWAHQDGDNKAWHPIRWTHREEADYFIFQGVEERDQGMFGTMGSTLR